ncbi:unnamed protein product, partial [Linum tenue]
PTAPLPPLFFSLSQTHGRSRDGLRRRRLRRRAEMRRPAGGSDGAENRRPDPPRDDVPDVGFGPGLLRDPLLREPVLLVPDPAHVHLRHLGPNRRCPLGPPPGQDAPDTCPLRRDKVGLHHEPGPVQCQGTRPHHHLRQRRRRHRLRHPHLERRQAVLQAPDDLRSRHVGHDHHSGARIRLGRTFPALPRGGRGNVSTPRKREETEIRSNQNPILPHRPSHQLQLLHLPRLPLHHAHLLLLGLLDVPQLGPRAAARVRFKRARDRFVRVRLVHHLVLPGQPAGQPVVRNRKCSGRVRPGHVRDDPAHLLVRHIQGQDIPNLLQQPVSIQRVSIRHPEHRRF